MDTPPPTETDRQSAVTCSALLGELAVSEDRLNTAMQDAAKATLALNDALAAHALLLRKLEENSPNDKVSDPATR
jgi:hypothetical protein